MDAKAVFEILVRENTAMLLAFLRSGVRDSHAVDDLFQETVLTAWKRLDDFDRSRPIGPWLRGIASRLMLAHFRKSTAAALPIGTAEVEWLEHRFEAIQRKPGDSFEDKLEALRECIANLPENYRAPIRMRYSEGCSFEEVCETLRLAHETLRKRISRAKQKLAVCLDSKLQLGEA
ncbi:MAG: sigma-70 family RNA polymerase sigma factor [Pirellulaceae bacterium]